MKNVFSHYKPIRERFKEYENLLKELGKISNDSQLIQNIPSY